MVTIDRPRVSLVLLLLTAIMLVHPPNARADRIDIDDPSVLGPVLLSDRFLDANPLELSVAEVRYQGGIYSYVYAVSSSPYFPGTSCCEAGMVSFAVTGHPLEDTWGAINSSEDFWTLNRPGGTYRIRVEYLANLRWFPCCFSTSLRPIRRGLRAVASPALGPRDFHLHWPSERLRPPP